MAGRISKQAQVALGPLNQKCAKIGQDFGEGLQKLMTTAWQSFSQIQQQSPGQLIGGGTGELGGSTGTRGKRGGTPAQHRKAGKAGGQARARKLNNTSNTNGAAGETSAL